MAIAAAEKKVNGTKDNDYKVADIGLADWGRREIEIAEKRCLD